MNTALVTTDLQPHGAQTLSERLVLHGLRDLQAGHLTVVTPGRRIELGRPGAEPRATVTVHDARFWNAVLMRGSLGAGEAFAEGWWEADDLTAVVQLVARNGMNTLEGRWTATARPLLRLYHALRRNTRRGSAANIAAHYDLSNAFFALFLDETMTYSSGIFERPEASLYEASVAKIDRLCRKLDLRPEDHLLEIGTGWGALAIHAAREYGCRVTTTTISSEQHAYACEQVAAAGLEDRITLLQEDYRDLRGAYDKVVSVEMIEAVGHHYYETFFSTVAGLLKPDGVAAIQAITLPDHCFEAHKTEVDFIKRYIFPGSCIPSIAALSGAMARSSDLRLFHLEDITPHYARTLLEWDARFRANADQVSALGFDAAFQRLWRFYLCYCAGGFAERYLGAVQMVLTRPEARPEPILPPLERSRPS